MSTRQEQSLRPATPEELRIHLQVIRQIKEEARYINPHDPRQMIPFIERIENVAKRYGWARGGADSGKPLMIDENIVWQDIKDKNPLPDVLDIAPREALRAAYREMKKAINKARRR